MGGLGVGLGAGGVTLGLPGVTGFGVDGFADGVTVALGSGVVEVGSVSVCSLEPQPTKIPSALTADSQIEDLMPVLIVSPGGQRWLFGAKPVVHPERIGPAKRMPMGSSRKLHNRRKHRSGEIADSERPRTHDPNWAWTRAGCGSELERQSVESGHLESIHVDRFSRPRRASAVVQNCAKKFQIVAPELGAGVWGPLNSHHVTG